jgi:hypothetical protein
MVKGAGRTPLRKATTRSARKEPESESDDDVVDPNGNMNFAGGGGGDESSSDDEEVFNLGADDDEDDSEDDDSNVSVVGKWPATLDLVVMHDALEMIRIMSRHSKDLRNPLIRWSVKTYPHYIDPTTLHVYKPTHYI